MDDAALDNIVEFEWEFTEKVDGTNIRIMVKPEGITFGLAKAIAAGTVAFEIYWEELDGNGDIQPHVRITPKA